MITVGGESSPAADEILMQNILKEQVKLVEMVEPHQVERSHSVDQDLETNSNNVINDVNNRSIFSPRPSKPPATVHLKPRPRTTALDLRPDSPSSVLCWDDVKDPFGYGETEKTLMNQMMDELLYDPVTSCPLNTRNSTEENVDNDDDVARLGSSRSILLQKELVDHEEFITSLESVCNVQIVSLGEEIQSNTPDIILSEDTGIFIIDQLQSNNLNDFIHNCLRSNRQKFKKVFFISLGNWQLHLDVLTLCKSAAGQRCQTVGLYAGDHTSIAHILDQILSEEPHHQQSHPAIQEYSSLQEKVLVRLYPVLNYFSARAILKKVVIAEFFKLSHAQLKELFPWLSSETVDKIVQRSNAFIGVKKKM